MKKIIHKGIRTKLDPNNEQKTLLAKSAGCARYAYNWALDYQEKNHEDGGKFLGKIDMHKIFVATEKQENEWLYEISKCSPQQAIRNSVTAYERFFKGQAKFPNFKKKGQNDKFYVDSCIKIKDKHIHIAKVGWVKVYEDISRFENIIIKSLVISREADEWFMAFGYDEEIEVEDKPFTPIGGDLGIKTFATLSNEKTFDTPNNYKKLKNKLKRLQRKLARQSLVPKVIINKNGKEQTVKASSKNREKTKIKIAKTHQKIRHQREDTTHKLTSYVTKNHSDACFEDLGVKNMMKNHNLAAALANSNFGEIRRQLQYKGLWYDCSIFLADRFYPSSKTCCCCGYKKVDLKLSDRVFKCDECGMILDRDLNAAINLLMLLYLCNKMSYTDFEKIVHCSEEQYNALKIKTASSAGLACGDPKIASRKAGGGQRSRNQTSDLLAVSGNV